MTRHISRYDLACDVFCNLCYLYDFGCCCSLTDRYVCAIYLDGSESGGLHHLMDLQKILNDSSVEWKEVTLEIED